MKYLQLAILICLCSICFAQNLEFELNKQVELTTKSGSVLRGELIKMDKEAIVVKTDFGESTVLKSEITTLDYLKKEYDSDRTNNSYSASHYLMTQSGFGLKKGESYYENIYIWLNSYTVGVTDNFSLSVGAEIFSLLFSRFPVMFFTPKVSVPFKGGAFSVSTTLVTVPQEDFESAGFLQGAVTFGDYRNNFTVGAGMGYTFSDGFEDRIIPVTLSGMFALSDRLSMVSENWIVSSSGYTEGIISLGLRIHSKSKNNSLNLALWRVTEDMGPLIALPFVSATIALK